MKVAIVTSWINWDAPLLMWPNWNAKIAINKENSLNCPSRIPASLAKEDSSPANIKSLFKIQGLANINVTASNKAGNAMPFITEKSSFAPNIKKNNTKKKSRSGFNFSEMNSDTGCLAKTTPAKNAPVS